MMPGTLSITVDISGLTVANEVLELIPGKIDVLGLLLKILIDILKPAETTAVWTGPVNLHGPLATEVDPDAVFEISGVISGPGGLFKTGLGKLILTGANMARRIKTATG